MLLCCEVGVRMAAVKCEQYWQRCSNIFDVLVLTVCVISLCIMLAEPANEGEEVEGVIDTILIVVRYAVQV